MQEILMIVEEKMEKVMENLDRNLAGIRTGRANPKILDHVMVDYYGSPTPINQMSSVSVVEGRQLVIKPYDRQMIKEMEATLAKSDLEYPVQNDGDVLRINIPALTEETRKALTKDAAKVGEEAKVAIRNARRDGNDLVKKNDELTEDLKKSAQDDIQKLTDKYVKQIDETVKTKNEEIMSI